MVNPVLFDTEHAFGYLIPDRFYAEDREWIYRHNFCNGLSIPLSPLAGLIRLCVSLYFLYQIKYYYRPRLDEDIRGLEVYLRDSSWAKEEKEELDKQKVELDKLENFCKAQAIRSGAEILCLGIFIGTIVDGFMTYQHLKLPVYTEV